MILAIDMGNTNIVVGGISEGGTHFLERITTQQGKTDPCDISRAVASTSTMRP